MKLIDADRLVEVLRRNFGNTGGAAVLTQLIENAPIIEVAQPKHGLWGGWTTRTCVGTDEFSEPKMADRRFYRCSECRNGTVVKSNYCSKCGAKMNL